MDHEILLSPGRGNEIEPDDRDLSNPRRTWPIGQNPAPALLSLDDEHVAIAGDWHGNLEWATCIIPAIAAAQPGIRTILHTGNIGTWPGALGRLTVTVRGVTEEMIYDELPADPGIVYAFAGIREGATVKTHWTMNRDWALALLQLLLSGTAYTRVTSHWHDDQFRQKYTAELFVQGIGSFSAAHLMAIVDE